MSIFSSSTVNIYGAPGMKFLQIMRPYHWIKNIFVFAALLFGQKLIDLPFQIALLLWVLSCIGIIYTGRLG